MENILKSAFILFLVMISGKILAQPDGPSPMNPEDMAKHETEWMKQELSLTAKQLPIIDSLNLAISKLRQKAFEESQGDFESIRPAMEKIDAEVLPKFKAILSEKQYDLYIEKQKERRENGPGPH